MYHYFNPGRQTDPQRLGRILLDRREYFAGGQPTPISGYSPSANRVVIPFTFGKDSFLTYCLAVELGLKPTLVYFNEPTEIYNRPHKLALIARFRREQGVAVHYLENEFGELRDYGSGWFGWELALTTWALFALPFAYATRARYLLFANEASCNHWFYDSTGRRVAPQFEQSWPATAGLSSLVQAHSGGALSAASLLEGIYESGILAILKRRYSWTLPYLMSCWAETKAAARSRWCQACAKCARLYLYLTAVGIAPSAVEFSGSMFTTAKRPLFPVFIRTRADQLNTDRLEECLNFYIAYLRGCREPLARQFWQSPLRRVVGRQFPILVNRYYSVHPEVSTPAPWRPRVRQIFVSTLAPVRRELLQLFRQPRH